MDPRARFLYSAAHFYCTLAPETSSYLMNQHNEVMPVEHATIRTSDRACRACGVITIGGWNTLSRVVTQRGPSNPSPTSRRERYRSTTSDDSTVNKNLETYCSRCYRTTKRRVSTTKNALPAPESSGPTPLTGPSVINTVKAGGKKRTKSRKSRGLQALLTMSAIKSDERRQGLGLVDLMKRV